MFNLHRKLTGEVPFVYNKGGSSGPSAEETEASQLAAEKRAEDLRKIQEEESRAYIARQQKNEEMGAEVEKTIARRQWERDQGLETARETKQTRLDEFATDEAGYLDQRDVYERDYKDYQRRQDVSDELKSRSGLAGLMTDSGQAGYTAPTREDYSPEEAARFQSRNLDLVETKAQNKERNDAYEAYLAEQDRYGLKQDISEGEKQELIDNAARKQQDYDYKMMKYEQDLVEYNAKVAEAGESEGPMYEGTAPEKPEEPEIEDVDTASDYEKDKELYEYNLAKWEASDAEDKGEKPTFEQEDPDVAPDMAKYLSKSDMALIKEQQDWDTATDKVGERAGSVYTDDVDYKRASEALKEKRAKWDTAAMDIDTDEPRKAPMVLGQKKFGRKKSLSLLSDDETTGLGV